MRKSSTRNIALGGLFAALALVFMCVGGLVPVATYILPILCCLLLQIVLVFCGRRIGWAWYLAVSVLSLLIGSDKESALIFLAIGYYPLIRYKLTKGVVGALARFLIFNGSMLLVYNILFRLFGMEGIILDTELGVWSILLMLILGNATFFLLDHLLGSMERKLRRNEAR